MHKGPASRPDRAEGTVESSRWSDREESVDFLLKAVLAGLVRHEIAADLDETSALRRALLGLIVTVQDAAPPAAQALIDYLLRDFAPVADRFDARDRQPLVASEHVIRAQLRDGRVRLVMRREFGEQLLAEVIQGLSAPDDTDGGSDGAGNGVSRPERRGCGRRRGASRRRTGR